MLVLIVLVGILSLLLVVTTSVAYFAIPRGRLCPECGGATSPVALRKLLVTLTPGLEWRWCSRCGWEGPGRRVPDLGRLNPPANHGSGFRWGDQNTEEIPTFYWQPEVSDAEGDARPSPFSGLNRRAAEEPIESEPPGFYFRPPGKQEPPRFQWGPTDRRRPPPRPPRAQRPRPWYHLQWLSPKEPLGFQWKDQQD